MARKRKRVARKAKTRLRRKNPALLVIRNPSKRRRCKKRGKAKATCKRTRKNCCALRLNPKRTRRPRRARTARSSASIPALFRQKRITVPELLAHAKRDSQFKAALARYRRFHGAYPDDVSVMEIPGKNLGFRYAVGLGDTRAHEYEVPKSSGRSNGPPFRHNFKKGRQVTATDPWGKGLYVLKRKGSRLRVTDRGIQD